MAQINKTEIQSSYFVQKRFFCYYNEQLPPIFLRFELQIPNFIFYIISI